MGSKEGSKIFDVKRARCMDGYCCVHKLMGHQFITLVFVVGRKIKIPRENYGTFNSVYNLQNTLNGISILEVFIFVDIYNMDLF